MDYKEAIKEIEARMNETPEIGLSNYTPEEVEATVNMTNDIWQIVQDATE
tara:strand:+ start:1396 stop:1545 length:150 start_codon:yes stop_codon:yes gene_type:complete